MTRYTMPARSQGKLYTQRVVIARECADVHRWVFAHSMDPEVEFTVRKWLYQRLDSFYCDLQAAYMPHVPVGLQGLNSRDAVKAIIKATGLNPHLSVYGWPFCLDDADAAEGGAA